MPVAEDMAWLLQWQTCLLRCAQFSCELRRWHGPCAPHDKASAAGPMEKLHSLPKLVLDSEEARSVQQQYDHLIVEMDQFEKATVEVIASLHTLLYTSIYNSECFSAGTVYNSGVTFALAALF